MSQPDSIFATRSTLLVRLKDLDNQQAWQEFFDVYWVLLFNFARRAGLNEKDAEEVVMETVETVARKIEDFEYNRQRGRFKGWLLTMSASSWETASARKSIRPRRGWVKSLRRN